MVQMTWTNDCLVPNSHDAIGLSGSPAAAVFQGKIYLFHEGRNNDGRIWYSTFDGSNWSQDRALAGGTYYGIRNSPSVAVFNNRLYVVYHDHNDRLQVGGFDSSGNWFNINNVPAYLVSYSPSVAVFQNRLYIAYQGGGSNSGNLMYTSTDGNSWAPEARVGSVSMLGAPALVVYQNRLHFFHKGTNETVDLSLALAIDNICELMGIDDPWVTMVIDISMALIDEFTPVGDAKTAAQAGIIIAELASKATSRKGDWLWHTAFDGQEWKNDVLCPSAEDAYGINSEFPAVVEYGNRLFCIRQGRDSSYLWCGVHGGRGWSQDQQLGINGNTFCTTGAPALVVFNGTLYCFHQERDDRGWLWMTTLNIPPLNIPGAAPSAATTTAVNPMLNPWVFDAAYYLMSYPDLQNAFGISNYAAAQNHWLTYGIFEGRRASFEFDSPYYLATNPDVAAVYGARNFKGAIEHYVIYGKGEGRVGSSPESRGKTNILVFDPQFYLNMYADLRNAFGSNLTAATNHWVNNGINEARQGSLYFSAPYYLATNPDVAAVYGATNYAGAIEHYLKYGRNEGRKGSLF